VHSPFITVRSLAVVALVALATPLPSLSQVPPDSVRRFPSFVVSGTLVTPQGAPLPRQTVHVFLWQDGRSYVQLGRVGNSSGAVRPSARTDAAGRFSIRVDSAYVRRHFGITEYTVGVYRDRRPVAAQPAGAVSPAFDLRRVVQARYRLDVGRVALQNE